MNLSKNFKNMTGFVTMDQQSRLELDPGNIDDLQTFTRHEIKIEQ